MAEAIKVYLIKDGRRGKNLYKNFAPDCISKWENLISIDNIDEADYVIVITNVLGINLSKIPPEKILYFKREPDEFKFLKRVWDKVNHKSYKFPIENSYMLQHWNIDKTYDELINCKFPEKIRNLSWVTTNYGDIKGFDIYGSAEELSGHKLRMVFLRKFLEKYPDKIDLYGKRLITPPFLGKFNKGEIYDKWDGLADYKYTFAFENSWQKGYWSEKLNDAILAGCMPIFWGCPNLEEFFPNGSFIRLDITKEDALERSLEIIGSDYRDKNINALYEAKKLILNKYNVWPSLHRIINDINQKEKNMNAKTIFPNSISTSQYYLSFLDNTGKLTSVSATTPFKPNSRILEIGGGDKPLFRPNLDIRKLPTVDIVCDLEERWPIDNEFCDGVFGQFIIEHISWRKTEHFVSECFRILAPGGSTMMIGPNTLEQCKEVAKLNKISIESCSLLFGGQEERGWNEHKAAFSPDYAIEIFKKVGFEKVEIETWPGQIWTGARTDMIIKAWKGENMTQQQQGIIAQGWYKDLENKMNTPIQEASNLNIIVSGSRINQEKVKLNIGSFTVCFKGWINCDILDLNAYANKEGYKFKQFDATKTIPWPDNSVDLIIASHFMEHITRQEGTQFLNECFRVMKPGGIIRLTVPDTELIADQYLHNSNFREKFEENEGVKNSEDLCEAYWNFITAGHKTAYDKDSLEFKMKFAGFVDILRSQFGMSRSEEIRVETKDMFEDHSLYMEGIKPLVNDKKELDFNPGASGNNLEPYQLYLQGLINEGKQ